MQSAVCTEPRPKEACGFSDRRLAGRNAGETSRIRQVSLENTTDSITPEPQAPPQATEPVAPAPAVETSGEPPRGAIAEWAITILLLLFLTTTLVQAYVIPTGSMEDTLLIGDHLLGDKLAFAPSGPGS